jgi:hypothetical protein
MVGDRILHLPDRGLLLVSTDIHGNLRDFQQVVEHFVSADRRVQAPILLFTGDLIHGPAPGDKEGWPDLLGQYYEDRSAEVLEAFFALQDRFPGCVHSLLGNHEHSHVGGPHTPKFWPDETAHLEQVLGPERAVAYNKRLACFPLLAVAPCGVVLTHAAPNVEIESPDQLAAVAYEGYAETNLMDVFTKDPLCRLLWCRSCPTDTARRFLDAFVRHGAPAHVVAFGHDVVSDGFDRIDQFQVQFSTSFGLADARKTLLVLDLGQSYRSSADLRLGREIRRLYPASV